jgi:hypothetical protein
MGLLQCSANNKARAEGEEVPLGTSGGEDITGDDS